ncbi:MAG: peptidase C39, partial [Bacteroidaceae bacterium]|nr:peptidase C39 [Bacteroidaceae bacterium]
QYIFSSFNKRLEDSSRYLISCYVNNSVDETLRKFDLWYNKDKFDHERIINNSEEYIHTDAVETEMEKHRIWREKTSLTATPTVLVNGYILPQEYELEDLAMIANIDITRKNILQDNNGKHEPLATD